MNDEKKLLWDMAEHKLSKLIHIAMADLVAAERDPRFTIDMGVWHDPDDREDNVCTVCFAGSTMYRSGVAAIEGMPHADHPDWPAWHALNELRNGYVEHAAAWLELDTRKYMNQDRFIAPYSVYVPQFKNDMWALADDLEARGL